MECILIIKKRITMKKTLLFCGIFAIAAFNFLSCDDEDDNNNSNSSDNGGARRPSRFVDPINKIRDISINAHVCPLVL